MRRLAAVVTAGGRGQRMGAGTPKQFLELAGRPVLARAIQGLLDWLQQTGDVQLELVLTHPADAAAETRALLDDTLARCEPQTRSRLKARCVTGGETRQDSVRLGLEALQESPEAVFIHDGVRPLAGAALARRLLAELDACPDCVATAPLLPAGDTLKQLDGSGRIVATVDREAVRAVQTPQLLRMPLALELHRRARDTSVQGTDDISLVEHFAAGEVRAVEGEPSNLKVTRPQDLPVAAALLEERESLMNQPEFRVGQGFDVHAFCEGRPLVLGGVEIPFDKGLAGHSDADVLLHAISDALLGAASLGDIGQHFPDTDPAWKGADSWNLLQAVGQLVSREGWRISNLDATLICQRPKLAPHREAMRARICEALQLEPGQVSLKATTTEHLGFTGREEGIASQAVVLLQRS